MTSPTLNFTTASSCLETILQYSLSNSGITYSPNIDFSIFGLAAVSTLFYYNDLISKIDEKWDVSKSIEQFFIPLPSKFPLPVDSSSLFSEDDSENSAPPLKPSAREIATKIAFYITPLILNYLISKLAIFALNHSMGMIGPIPGFSSENTSIEVQPSYFSQAAQTFQLMRIIQLATSVVLFGVSSLSHECLQIGALALSISFASRTQWLIATITDPTKRSFFVPGFGQWDFAPRFTLIQRVNISDSLELLQSRANDIGNLFQNLITNLKNGDFRITPVKQTHVEKIPTAYRKVNNTGQFEPYLYRYETRISWEIITTLSIQIKQQLEKIWDATTSVTCTLVGQFTPIEGIPVSASTKVQLL
ncbi:MAG: hypothetical protein K9M07_04540 [Simkaniaceae bacterium]|nr:hypothetical protein [Simkaniaceae bacterium]